MAGSAATGHARFDSLLGSVSDQFAHELAKNRELSSCVTELRARLQELETDVGSGTSFQSAVTDRPPDRTPRDHEPWHVPVEQRRDGISTPKQSLQATACRKEVNVMWRIPSKGASNSCSDLDSLKSFRTIEDDFYRHIRLMFNEQSERLENFFDRHIPEQKDRSFLYGGNQMSSQEWKKTPSLQSQDWKKTNSQEAPVQWKVSQPSHDSTRMSKALRASSVLYEPEDLPAVGRTSSIQINCQNKVKRIVLSNTFEFLFAMMILSNAIYLGIETDYMARTSSQRTPAVFHVFQYLYVAVFTVELIMRWIADGFVNFLCGTKYWVWNCFDAFTVAGSLIEAGLTTVQLMTEVRVEEMRGISNVRLLRIIRVARLLRVFRISRILRFVGALRTLVYSIIGTLVSLFWALVLLILIMYSFGVVFTQAAGDHVTDQRAEREMVGNFTIDDDSTPLAHYWGNLSTSMFTLFMSIAAGISWELVVEPLSTVGWFFPGLFCVFIAFTYFAVLNIVTANFCQSAIDSARYDRDIIVEGVIRQKKLYTHLLRSLYYQFDTNKSGSVSFKELQASFRDPEVQAYLSSLDLEAEDAWTLFKLLDTNQGDDIDQNEFVSGCMRLRGNAKKMDLAMLIEDNKFASAQLASFMEHVDRELKVLNRQMEASLKGMRAAPAGFGLMAIPPRNAPRTPK